MPANQSARIRRDRGAAGHALPVGTRPKSLGFAAENRSESLGLRCRAIHVDALPAEVPRASAGGSRVPRRGAAPLSRAPRAYNPGRIVHNLGDGSPGATALAGPGTWSGVDFSIRPVNM